MEIPEGLRYTKEHEWVKVEGNTAIMGITEFAQSELGDVVFVDPAAVGKIVKQKDSVCVVESTKAASDVYAPIGGTIAEVNAALANAPDLVNKSPYGEGWMIKFKGISTQEIETLLTAAQYRAHLEKR